MSSSFMSQEEIEKLISKLHSGSKDPLTENNREKLSGSEYEVQEVKFPELTPREPGEKQRSPAYFKDIPVTLTLELGKATLTVREILQLQKGSVIKLDRLAGENALLRVNEKTLAWGEVVVINENFGCRIAEILAEDDSEAGEE